MRRLVVYLVSCLLANGCILNPQPHPPEDQGSVEAPDAGASPGTGGVSYDASAVDASASDAPSSVPIVVGDAAADALAHGDTDAAADAESADAAADGPPGPTTDGDAGPGGDDADAAHAADAPDAAPATDAANSDEWADAVDETTRASSD